MIAEEVLTEASGLLNDENRDLFDADMLLPHLIKAHGELDLHMQAAGLQNLMETSSVISVPTSKTTITLSDITNLIYPKKLWERLAGSSVLYTPMVESMWLPQRDKADSLLNWAWTGNEIKLVGATSAREVKVDYLKGLTALTTKNDSIPYPQSKLFLASRVAAIASARLQNYTKAEMFNSDAETWLEKFLNIQIKSKQSSAIRHRRMR